jgi:hypothetical protein
MASAPHFCGILPPPDRNDVVRAVSKTIGLIRRKYLLKACDIAQTLKQPDGVAPDAETIRRAERGDTLLSFDLIAQLAFLYHECADPLRIVMEPAPTGEPTTLEDRLALIEREAAAIRREIAS